MIFRQEILDEIFRDCKTPEDLFGADGIFK
jgi:hypothetical protein